MNLVVDREFQLHAIIARLRSISALLEELIEKASDEELSLALWVNFNFITNT